MEVGETLGGRYRLLDELGRGGMAVVWRARDEVLGRPVAVKLLAGRYADDPQSRARIRDEARAAATLSHPNIAQIYDYGEATGAGVTLPYVVMELINGPTLQQRVASGPLPPRTVFRICGEVAAGLAAAHVDGLVHRDIKMANIMVTPGGAKVVDFGIAAAAGPAQPEEMLVGTPAYLAPERLTGSSVLPASDVYALGVLLYRLLAHESPWSVDSTTQMLRAHVYVEPAPLPALPGVPTAVAVLVARCLGKDPAARPSASEVSATLADATEASVADQPRPEREDVGAPQRRVTSPADGPDDSGGSAGSAASDVPGDSGGTGGSGGTGRRDGLDAETMNAVRPDAPGVAGRPRPAGSGARRVPERQRKVLLAGGVAVVTVAALLGWFLLGEQRTGGEPGAGAAARSADPIVSSTAGTTSAAAGGDRSVPDGTRLPGRPPPGGESAATSAGTSPTGSASGSASTPGDGDAPVVSPAPEGSRLTSPGGVVYAICSQGKAKLTSWEPTDGYSAQDVEPGPALTTAIVFRGASNTYRMTITCVAGTPTQVSLPL